MNDFPAIGTTKYVVRILPDADGHTPNYGPFVVRTVSRKAAISKVRRTWLNSNWGRSCELEIQAANRFVPAYQR